MEIVNYHTLYEGVSGLKSIRTSAVPKTSPLIIDGKEYAMNDINIVRYKRQTVASSLQSANLTNYGSSLLPKSTFMRMASLESRQDKHHLVDNIKYDAPRMSVAEEKASIMTLLYLDYIESKNS
jgi:hypothetical protein